MQPNPEAAAVAARLRGVLGELNISGAELARRLDVPQSNIARRLLGKTPITVPELLRYAEVLEIPATRLLPADQTAAAS